MVWVRQKEWDKLQETITNLQSKLEKYESKIDQYENELNRLRQERERYAATIESYKNALKEIGVYMPLIDEYLRKYNEGDGVNQENPEMNADDSKNDSNYQIPVVEKTKEETEEIDPLQEARNVEIEQGVVRALMRRGFPEWLITNPLVYMGMRHVELERMHPSKALELATKELEDMKTQNEREELVEWATNYFEKISKKLPF